MEPRSGMSIYLSIYLLEMGVRDGWVRGREIRALLDQNMCAWLKEEAVRWEVGKGYGWDMGVRGMLG